MKFPENLNDAGNELLGRVLHPQLTGCAVVTQAEVRRRGADHMDTAIG